MTQRLFNRLMAVFTVVIILFLFTASYLHDGDHHRLRNSARVEHLDRGQTGHLGVALPR
jgi:hypothetical protein